MGIKIVYEPSIFVSGWYENENGLTPQSWYDRDLTSDIDDGSGGGGGGVILIDILEPPFFDDDDEFLAMPPITVEVLPGYFLDGDVFFIPMSVRALGPPDKMLKNEVIRVR
jgi:hypothetical protein